MNRWTFALTCPHDGAPVQPVAQGTTNGWQTSAIALMDECEQLRMEAGRG